VAFFAIVNKSGKRRPKYTQLRRLSAKGSYYLVVQIWTKDKILQVRQEIAMAKL
jgi:hypothetical protein